MLACPRITKNGSNVGLPKKKLESSEAGKPLAAAASVSAASRQSEPVGTTLKNKTAQTWTGKNTFMSPTVISARSHSEAAGGSGGCSSGSDEAALKRNMNRDTGWQLEHGPGAWLPAEKGCSLKSGCRRDRHGDRRGLVRLGVTCPAPGGTGPGHCGHDSEAADATVPWQQARTEGYIMALIPFPDLPWNPC
jgi:hypothetical protein